MTRRILGPTLISPGLKIPNPTEKQNSACRMAAGMLYFLFGWERTEFAMAILSGIFSRLLARPSALWVFPGPLSSRPGKSTEGRRDYA
jgi:hypothetical protein